MGMIRTFFFFFLVGKGLRSPNHRVNLISELFDVSQVWALGRTWVLIGIKGRALTLGNQKKKRILLPFIVCRLNNI